MLVEAARAVAFDDELLRHPVTRAEFHHEMAAMAAAGTGREVGKSGNGVIRAAPAGNSDCAFARCSY